MTLQVQNQLKLQTYSTISLHPLLLKLRKISNIPINTFLFFLKIDLDDSFSLSPTDKYEIISIISSLDLKNQLDLIEYLLKIIKLLKNDISNQLFDIFNVSFSTGVFPFILKIAKVVPIHKEPSRLVCSNYYPVSLLSNLEKIEKLMYIQQLEFLNFLMIAIPFTIWFQAKIFYNTCSN